MEHTRSRDDVALENLVGSEIRLSLWSRQQALWLLSQAEGGNEVARCLMLAIDHSIEKLGAGIAGKRGHLRCICCGAELTTITYGMMIGLLSPATLVPGEPNCVLSVLVCEACAQASEAEVMVRTQAGVQRRLPTLRFLSHPEGGRA